jgi:aminoglycoside phosphotransferase (APT) family kinase protein
VKGATVETYTITKENNRYVVRNNDGARMGSARTKQQAQHQIVDALTMLADQSSRVTAAGEAGTT